MKAGDLKHMIVIERPTEGAPDSNGRRQTGWAEFCRAAAGVRDVSGREFYQAAAYQMEDVITFTLRYSPLIGARMRILWRGKRYEILQINHLSYRGDYMQIKARLVRSEGDG